MKLVKREMGFSEYVQLGDREASLKINVQVWVLGNGHAKKTELYHRVR